MISKSPKGEQARQYFIACEQGLKMAMKQMQNNQVDFNAIVNVLQTTQQDIKALQINQNQQLQENMRFQQDQLSALTSMLTTITSTLPQPYKPPYTRWIKQIYEKINILKERYDTTTKAVLCKCYREIEVTYDIDLSTYQQDYELRHNLNTSYMLNVIDENSTLRQFLDVILDNEIEQIDENIREEKSFGRKP